MRILVVDDEPMNRRLLDDLLTVQSHDVLLAGDGLEALQILSSNEIDLAIVDWMMPKMNGIELIKAIRARGNSEQYIYIILLTALDAEENLVTGFQAGADDYITKPILPRQLTARINAGMRIVQHDHDQKANLKKVEKAARYDHLTGLMNRRYFLEIAEEHMAKAQVDGAALSLVMLDVDRFKVINDTYGHIIGDEVLQYISDVCRTTFTDSNIIWGRYGGEEFVGLLRGHSGENARRFAETLRLNIAKKPIRTSAGEIVVTISLGIETLNTSIEHFEQLLDRADKALYAAKHNGRNCVVLYSMGAAS